jgi:hypothetical protein
VVLRWYREGISWGFIITSFGCHYGDDLSLLVSSNLESVSFTFVFWFMWEKCHNLALELYRFLYNEKGNSSPLPAPTSFSLPTPLPSGKARVLLSTSVWACAAVVAFEASRSGPPTVAMAGVRETTHGGVGL